MKKLLNVQYRVYFTSLRELTQWVSARGFAYEEPDFLDEGKLHSWKNDKDKLRLTVAADVFNEQKRLKTITPEEWDNNSVKVEKIPDPAAPSDDDVPF